MIDHSYGPLQRMPSPRDPVYLLSIKCLSTRRPDRAVPALPEETGKTEAMGA